MFAAAQHKLEDARTILQQLERAADPPVFRSLFNSFVSAARATTNALQKDGKNLQGFAQWYAEKQDEMKADELLRFIHKARTEDFHQGKHRLTFDTYIAHLSGKEAGPPPAPGAALVIGADGPYWLIDKGTPGERRVPVSGGSFAIRIAIANPPKTHLGANLQRTDPLSISRLALEYLQKLVHEARSRFGVG